MPKVYASAVIGAPIHRVWPLLRDFDGLPAWHPLIAESRIEGGQPADQVGCVRSFTLTDGGRIRERLLALSDYDFNLSYSILESPMGVEHYVATMELRPVTDGDRTFAQWSAEFDCDDAVADELARHIEANVFQAGLAALAQRCR